MGRVVPTIASPLRPTRQRAPAGLSVCASGLGIPLAPSLFERRSVISAGGALPNMDPCRQTTPLSFAQPEAWVAGQLAGDVPAGNQPIAIRRRGGFDPVALQGALADLVSRHETWRTTLQIDGGAPGPVVGA